MCSTSFLRGFAVLTGVILTLASVFGIGFSLFLIFGEPLDRYTSGTYTPSWEDIGMLLSSLSLWAINSSWSSDFTTSSTYYPNTRSTWI